MRSSPPLPIDPVEIIDGFDPACLVDPHPEALDLIGAGVRTRPANEMIEVDADGDLVLLDELDHRRLLDLAAEAESQAWAADRRKLRYAYQWCVLNPPPDADRASATTWGEADPRHAECDVLLGGDGTPAVAAGAAADLGAALGTSTAAAMQLMADALNLRHRHPQVWARVEALEVAPWRARRFAQTAAHAPLEAARDVDARLADHVGSCGVKRIDAAVVEAIARLDPEGQEVAEQTAEDQWGVDLRHGRGSFYDGTSVLTATGDTVDLTAFHDLVAAVAHQLLDPEAPGSGAADLEQRKARALGVIADRAFAGLPVLDPDSAVRPAARTRLNLHLDATAIIEGTGATAVGTLDGLGPVTAERIRDWLAGTDATVLPVLHLERIDAVDPHDPPAWMRELVILRDRHCAFPGCQTASRCCDLDHIVPYDPTGPPGQTNPDNLAALCRRHHILKTFGGWRYTRNSDGSYTWRSPHGIRYLVHDGTTHRLD
jgi:hypothetical protein